MRREKFNAQVVRAAGFTAVGLLYLLMLTPASAAQIDAKDPRVQAERVQHTSPQGHGTLKGYLARPANASGKLPGVLLIHESRGLTPHTEDVARRLALEGFIVYAPDGLTSVGGYPGDENKARTMQGTLDRKKMTEDFIAAYRYLKTRKEVSGKVGVVGFGYGGTTAHEMATRLPDLAAAVAFYGFTPKLEDVPNIKAPLLIHYAGTDARSNERWPDYEKALKASSKKYTTHFYGDKHYGFFNDTTIYYDKDAAALSWKRTLEFLKANLS